jgi:hypothetical protein
MATTKKQNVATEAKVEAPKVREVLASDLIEEIEYMQKQSRKRFEEYVARFNKTVEAGHSLTDLGWYAADMVAEQHRAAQLSAALKTLRGETETTSTMSFLDRVATLQPVIEQYRSDAMRLAFNDANSQSTNAISTVLDATKEKATIGAWVAPGYAGSVATILARINREGTIFVDDVTPSAVS